MEFRQAAVRDSFRCCTRSVLSFSTACGVPYRGAAQEGSR